MNQQKVLIADDEDGVRELFRSITEEEGYQVFLAKNGLEAVQMARTYLPDVIVLDVRMPELDGMEAFERIKESLIDVPVIFITAFGSSDLAIDAMKHGAHNYITKPFDIEEIKIVIRKALHLRQLTNEVAVLKSGVWEDSDTAELIGTSTSMQEIFKTIGRVADNIAPILLCGEPGSGKELIARKIYKSSKWRDQRFITLNGYTDDSLFLIEMQKVKVDRFQTVFFRNIDLLSLSSQTLFFEHSQKRKNLRIIASTSADITSLVSAGKFREDLYYHLNVVSMLVPPLRERREDLPELANYYVKKYSSRYGKVIHGFTKEALQMIQDYTWPGNLNELENAIAHSAIVSSGNLIGKEDLPILMQKQSIETKTAKERHFFMGMSLSTAVNQFEKEMIQEVLIVSHGNKTKTAELLGISRRSLFNKMRDYDMLKGTENEPN